MSNNSKLQTIQALLAKAEGASTKAEAEAYTERAMKLMAKYGIEQAMLDALKTEEKEEVGGKYIMVEKPYARDRANACAMIMEAMGCKVVMHRRDGGVRLHVMGYPSDIERAELMTASLMVQATSAMLKAKPLPGENTTSFRKAFLLSFGTIVAARIRELERAAKDEAMVEQSGSSSLELVLVSRAEKVALVMQQKYPKVKEIKIKNTSITGRSAGRKAGREADIGGRRLGQAKQRELVG